jgi:hypothetical protein
MEKTKIDELADGLHAEESRLGAALAELQAQQAALDADLKRVRSALAGLNAKARGKAAVGKPAGLTLAEAEPLVVALLKQHGPLTVADINRHLAAEARQRDRGRSGLHLLVKNLLRGGCFTRQGDVWHLADNAAATEGQPSGPAR